MGDGNRYLEAMEQLQENLEEYDKLHKLTSKSAAEQTPQVHVYFVLGLCLLEMMDSPVAANTHDVQDSI